MFKFPSSNENVCHNDTECGIGGTCSLIVDNLKRCNCPELYNPLDLCHTFYYDTISNYFYIGFLVVTLICHTTLVGLISRHFLFEIKLWIKKWPTVPRVKFVMLSAIVILSLSSVIAAILYVCKSKAASFLTAIGPTVFVICYDIIIYSCFVMLIKSKNLGTLEFKWKVISKIIISSGCIGMIISLTAGILREIDYKYYDATATPITLGTILGVAVPTFTAFPVLIYSLVYISKHDSKDEPTMRILYRCTLIAVIIMSVMILNLFILILLSYGMPSQLPDVITLSRCISSIIIIYTESIFVTFVYNMRHAKRNGKITSGLSATPSSERVSASTPSTQSPDTMEVREDK